VSQHDLRGRAISRVAIAVALLASVLAPSSPVAAQAQTQSVPPSVDPYPRVGTPVLLQHGQQTIAFRPIQTVMNLAKPVVADRLLVRFQPAVTGPRRQWRRFRSDIRVARVPRPLGAY
jgi:hypothetical protein